MHYHGVRGPGAPAEYLHVTTHQGEPEVQRTLVSVARVVVVVLQAVSIKVDQVVTGHV